MVILETFLVIMEFVKHFKAHSVSGCVAEAHAAGHIGEALNLTGSGCSLSLANVGIFIVDDVCGGEAGTGAAGYGTGTTGDTALIVFIPHRVVL